MKHAAKVSQKVEKLGDGDEMNLQLKQNGCKRCKQKDGHELVEKQIVAKHLKL
jgi:hypothetical protein